MKYCLKLSGLSVLLSLSIVSAAPVDDKWSFDLRYVDGVPVLWESGMPNFTRFTLTEHEILDLSGTRKIMPDPENTGTAGRRFESGPGSQNFI